MKNILFFSIFFLMTITLYSDFDYESYLPQTFDYLNAQVDHILTELDDGLRTPGVTIFNQKYKIILQLTEFPTTIKETYISKLRYFIQMAGYSNYGENIIKAFGYEIEYKYKNKDYILLFQSVLVDYLRKEAEIGDKIALYVIFGMHNDFDNKILILVNEFDVIE